MFGWPQLFLIGFFVTTQLARQLQQEHTRWYAVIGKPGSARLEGTPAMDLELKGIRTHM